MSRLGGLGGADVVLATITQASYMGTHGQIGQGIGFRPIEAPPLYEQGSNPGLVPHVLQPAVFPDPGPITGVTMSI